MSGTPLLLYCFVFVLNDILVKNKWKEISSPDEQDGFIGTERNTKPLCSKSSGST